MRTFTGVERSSVHVFIWTCPQQGSLVPVNPADSMDLIIISFLMICAAVKAKEMYTTKWDNIDVDEILRSDRLLQNYNRCLMDQGSCSPEGSELKRNLPDALKSECSKCSAKQKENTDKVVNFLIEKRPEMWGPLQEKYDPDHTFYNKHYKMKEEKKQEATTTDQPAE